MLLTIQNSCLTLTVDTLGAQMMHILSADGTEYLWQGDPAYWADRALTLFPFIARLTKGRCKVHGTEYPMDIHGFALSSEFAAVSHAETELILELASNAETRRQYPFDFAFRVCCRLEENKICVTYEVENRSAETMPFAVGGHPGFRVPLVEGERFEDYTLEFSQACAPDRVGFTEQVFLSGQDRRYELENGKAIRLSHDLFDDDAIILKNMDREITLRSRISGRGVTVRFPDMPYLGLWHWPKTDAPYVCIEPWSSLPSRQDVVEELTCKSDLLRLTPGKTYNNCWTIEVHA